MPERSTWAGIESAALGLVGAGMVLAGTLVNGDRAHLAVTLVALGVLLIVLAAVLPRLQSFSAKLPGLGEISASLVPASTSVSDGALAPVGHPELDLRGASPHTSNADDFQKAVTGGPATYVTINLEGGKAWLSSRLYVFVSALAEIRGIGAVVFTSRANGIDTFAGVCPVDVVLTRLAWACPWLPEALAQAWMDLRGSDSHRPPRRRMSGGDAAALFAKYVGILQSPCFPPVLPPAAAPAVAGPIVYREEEWQDLGGLWEHANWLDAASVTELLGAGLTKDFVTGTSNTAEALQAATTTAAGQYIAVVNDRHEVRSVIDRSKLLGRLLMAQGLAGPPR